MTDRYDDEQQEFDPYDDAPEWTEDDEERYQAGQLEERRRRRIRRRQGASFAVLVLLVLGAGLAGAGINQGWWEWPFGNDADAATPRCSGPPAEIALPGEVRVNVLNATDTRGLAGAVGRELTARGYTVDDIGNEDSEVEVLDSVQVRHGADLLAEAKSVALHFRGVVLIEDTRTNDVVDVVIGAGYRKMAPAEEAAAAIAAAQPAPPPGCGPTTSATTTSTG